MWDKELDEGIFLCEHNSHILTADFLRSLVCVQAHLQNTYLKEPNEFCSNKLEFISYILLKNSKELNIELNHKKNFIPLSNKDKNNILQTELSLDYYDAQLFIYKLFDPKAKFDTACARCHKYMYVWEKICIECIDLKERYKSSIPPVGTIYRDGCKGYDYIDKGWRKTYYCLYNVKTGERHTTNCRKCKEYFDWLEEKHLTGNE